MFINISLFSCLYYYKKRAKNSNFYYTYVFFVSLCFSVFVYTTAIGVPKIAYTENIM